MRGTIVVDRADANEPIGAYTNARVYNNSIVTMSLVGSYATLEATWAAPADASMYVFSSPGWYGQISPGAFAMTGTFAIPEMSMVPGWDPSLGILPGLPNNGPRWTLLAVRGASLAELLQPLPSTDGMRQSSGWTGSAQ